MSTAPVFHIDLPAFRENPYPQLKRMRFEAPIAFVPELGRTLFTRLDDIKKAEPDTEHFSSEQPGGQNEPRDVIAGTIWALLSHPEQLEMALSGAVPWHQVMEEYVRWMAPIGMTPRRIAAPVSFKGIDFEAGDDVFFMFNSANHDEKYFENPERFDITRDASKHIAFGAGPHFCAGAWASKALIAEVALPKLFARFTPRLAGNIRLGGWAFRGVLNLPCTW